MTEGRTVLKGSLRQVWTFITGHWVPLLQLSAVPLAATLILSYIGSRIYIGAFGRILEMSAEMPVDPAAMSQLFKAQGVMMLTGLLSLVATTWLFVRIIRYYALGELSWASLGPGGIKPVLMTLLYAIGVGLLTAGVYFLTAIVVLIPMGILAAAAGTDHVVMLVLLISIASIALIAFVLWFYCRFAVGLPGVALGGSPDFFKEMWPLSKPDSWGLPLRFVAMMFVGWLVLLPVYGLLFWGLFSEMFQNTMQNQGQMRPDDMMQMITAMMPLNLALAVVQLPVIWFASLLLAEAYRRFGGK